MKIALIMSYNGSSFLGSQIQKETKNTIFGQLDIVLKKLGIDSNVIASGRTDKGVHATAQVAHLTLPTFWDDLLRLQTTLNKMLPPTIHIKKIFKVNEDFHARYSAKKRVYRYIIKEGDSNPFEDAFITFRKRVAFEDIQQNIKIFEGEHDFSNFMKTGSDTKGSVRIIYKAFAYRYKGTIVLYFEANGFLRTQIRFMVGSLFDMDKKTIEEQLHCVKKHKLKPAKGNGLYLTKIKY
jgi:tRNA pseudouridine38-40 synthase